MTATANEITAALREYRPHAADDRLHRLLYYIQGHHLGMLGSPAFTEPITSTPDGPRVAFVDDGRRHVRGVLSNATLNVVLMAAGRYGGLSPGELGRLARSEDPCRRTSFGLPIEHDALRAWFDFYDGLGSWQDGDRTRRLTREEVAAIHARTRAAAGARSWPVTTRQATAGSRYRLPLRDDLDAILAMFAERHAGSSACDILAEQLGWAPADADRLLSALAGYGLALTRIVQGGPEDVDHEPDDGAIVMSVYPDGEPYRVYVRDDARAGAGKAGYPAGRRWFHIAEDSDGPVTWSGVFYGDGVYVVRLYRPSDDHQPHEMEPATA